MSDNVVLEMLRSIRGELQEFRNERRIWRSDVELSFASSERDQDDLDVCFDRICDRLDRIERRLELHDPADA